MAGNEGYAPLSTVERYHSEDRAWKDEHAQKHGDLEQRVSRAEWKDEEHDKRLGAGARTMGQLTDALRPSIWKTASVVGGAFVLVAGVAWQLRSYPDRTEFDALRDSVRSINEQQIEQRADLRFIKVSLEKMERALLGNEIEKALDARTPPTPRGR